MPKRHVIFFLLLFAFAPAAQAGEFGATSIGPSLAWQPTECQKPSKPPLRANDVDAYNAAVNDYNNYLLRMRSYRACINDEAQRDAAAAAAAINAGLEAANRRINVELDSAKSELEAAKRSLQ